MPQDVGAEDDGDRPRAAAVDGAGARCARRASACWTPSGGWRRATTPPAWRLGEAIGDWSELGGYELEGQWDAACRRIVRAALADIGDRPAATLSGGERKRLVLDLLFASDAEVLLLDEPDNFLDVPAKRELEELIARRGRRSC